MSFKMKVSSGTLKSGTKILVYGVPSVGKTSFGLQAPKSFVLDLERGTNLFNAFGRNETPILTWEDLQSAVDWFLTPEASIYETFVIDTMDKAEALLHNFLCRTNRTKDGPKPVGTIELVADGFGKGHFVAVEEMRTLIAKLDKIADTGRTVICTAHCQYENVNNLMGSDYKRYTLKVNKHMAALFAEAFDVILFAKKEIIVKEGMFTGDKKRIKAIGGEKRVMYTCEAASHLAKSRYTLPATMEFSWANYAKAVATCRDPNLLRKGIMAKAEAHSEGLAKEVTAAFGRVGDDAAKLVAIGDWLDAKIQALEEEAEEQAQRAIEEAKIAPVQTQTQAQAVTATAAE
jgi:hypothetical protein